jgi:hypothetical protein
MVNKPVIFVYVIEPDKDVLKEICAGMEEEGMLFEVVTKVGLDIETLCYESASDSILGSGIGVYGKEIGFSLRSLPKGKLVYTYKNPTFIEARNLGANAARGVKRLPFK